MASIFLHYPVYVYLCMMDIYDQSIHDIYSMRVIYSFIHTQGQSIRETTPCFRYRLAVIIFDE